ncbi:hypothetical protein RhiirA1_398920 [Rhizophagus irregularis]|uniref:Uncharacterized protein n=1 Tax=Rhizophagus irregularis TaxID=588596 RepID=A0A2N0RBS9_9GLOM|nr:hypothetical protein RhiirA1_398920 [Rhizophagus irregularis]
MSMDKSRTNEEALDFISKFNEQYFHTVTYHLSSFVQDSFLKDLFEKNLSVSKDKVQILIESSSYEYTASTLSLIFSIVLYADDDDDDNSQDTDDYLMDASPFLEQDVDDLVKTSAKNSHKGKKSSELEATQILTGYETVGKEQERI